SPLESERFLMDYKITSPNVIHRSIGPHVSVPVRLDTFVYKVLKYKKNLQEMDMMFVRCPTPLIVSMSRFVKKRAYLVVGDYVKSSIDLKLPWLKKAAVSLWVRCNRWRQMKLFRNSLVLVNNDLMYRELRNILEDVYLVRTTTLQKSDFYTRNDTC